MTVPPTVLGEFALVLRAARIGLAGSVFLTPIGLLIGRQTGSGLGWLLEQYAIWFLLVLWVYVAVALLRLALSAGRAGWWRSRGR